METTYEERLRLVIDANIVISAYLKDSITRKLLLHPHVKVLIADYNINEFLYYKPLIMKKTKYSGEQFQVLSDLILPKITSVPETFYSKNINEAKKLIEHIDEKDVPVVALALSIKIMGSGLTTNI